MNKILVIEDNKEIRENTAEILEVNGYRVLTAENGKVGFDLARSYIPDIILCDIMMPETNGKMFLRLAKEDIITKNIPIVFFSAGSSPELRKELINSANKYLKKPFSEKELLLIIRNGLSHKSDGTQYEAALL